MTRRRTLTIALPLLTAAALLAGGPASLAPLNARTAAAPGLPNERPAGLMWSSDAPGTATYAHAVQYAAALVEGGYSDWRLPTLEELQGAVTDSDPATFGQTTPNSAGLAFWSSKKQGNMWAYMVQVSTDAQGYPIPSQSGQVIRATQQGSFCFVKCVRP